MPASSISIVSMQAIPHDKLTKPNPQNHSSHPECSDIFPHLYMQTRKNSTKAPIANA